jgi:hypothetical protein
MRFTTKQKSCKSNFVLKTASFVWTRMLKIIYYRLHFQWLSKRRLHNSHIYKNNGRLIAPTAQYLDRHTRAHIINMRRVKIIHHLGAENRIASGTPHYAPSQRERLFCIFPASKTRAERSHGLTFNAHTNSITVGGD